MSNPSRVSLRAIRQRDFNAQHLDLIWSEQDRRTLLGIVDQLAAALEGALYLEDLAMNYREEMLPLHTEKADHAVAAIRAALALVDEEAPK